MPRRPRRSTAEVRRLILQAARDLFAEHGYNGAATKAIADRADVSETVLFRHFPTKSALFQAAVLEPFEDFLSRYTKSWQDRPLDETTAADAMRVYASELFDIVQEERSLFISLFAQGPQGEEMTDTFAELEQMGEAMAEVYGLEYDTVVAVRAAFVMIVTMAVFTDTLFPPGAVTRERIVTELGEILVGAALHPRTKRDDRPAE